ncbi:hypothetical protein HanPI659440_Chr01g0003021 [Helianthus annuus]|nr:hypothetical protein HanPI659440_Chr01g0003021 [Helianthus annuus]
MSNIATLSRIAIRRAIATAVVAINNYASLSSLITYLEIRISKRQNFSFKFQSQPLNSILPTTIKHKVQKQINSQLQPLALSEPKSHFLHLLQYPYVFSLGIMPSYIQ